MSATLRTNIEQQTLKNKNYRKVIYTDKYQQTVVMSLNIGEYINRETHKGTQFLRIEQGRGVAEIGKQRKQYRLKNGIALIVPPNTLHKIINTSKKEALKLYSIYTPPQHAHLQINKRQLPSTENKY